MDLRVQEQLFKCFLVPEITSKVENFRKMAWEDNGWPFFELSTSTVHQVKVYILCPMECKVSLYDKQGQLTSTIQTPANTCALVGTTRAMLAHAPDMQHNEFHVALLGQNFPFFVTVGTPGTLGGGLLPRHTPQDPPPDDMDQAADIKTSLHPQGLGPPIAALLTELKLSV